MSDVLIACPLFSPLRTRLLPDRLPNCKASAKSSRFASLTLSRSIGRSENISKSFTFEPCTTGKSLWCICYFKSCSIIPALVNYSERSEPHMRHFLSVRFLNRSRKRHLRSSVYAQQIWILIILIGAILDFFLQLIFHHRSRPLMLVVCHTTIFVDLNLAMRYSREVTWLSTLIGSPNHWIK